MYRSESKIGRRANRSVPRGADRMEAAQTQKWEKQTGEKADFGKTIDGLSVLRERKQILEREKRNSFLPRAIKVFGKQTLVVSFGLLFAFRTRNHSLRFPLFFSYMECRKTFCTPPCVLQEMYLCENCNQIKLHATVCSLHNSFFLGP